MLPLVEVMRPKLTLERVAFGKPTRVIQEVVCFGAEFQPMTFLGDPEILVQGKVEAESGWTQNRIPAGVAELVNRLQDKRASVEPSLSSRMIHAFALAGRVRTVIADIRVSAVTPANGLPGTRSPGGNASHLPSAGDSIQDAVPDIHPPPFTEGQVVQSRYHQAMRLSKAESPRRRACTCHPARTEYRCRTCEFRWWCR